MREMARHRYRQAQYVGLTRTQLDEIVRERDRQRQAVQRGEARAERMVELAQAPTSRKAMPGLECRVRNHWSHICRFRWASEAVQPSLKA